LSDVWLLGSIAVTNCDLSVYGPNGFFRGFQGSLAGLHAAQLDITTSYDTANNGITLGIKNTASSQANVTIEDRYTGQNVKLTIAAGATVPQFLSRIRFGGWYDFVITVASDSSIRYQIAGHIETGTPSISDPALGGLAL